MRIKSWTLLLLIAGIAAAGWPAAGAGLIIVTDPPETQGVVGEHVPRPRWPMPPPRVFRFAPLRVDYVKVDTRITNQIAVTAVDQEFYNPNPARLEGTFIFPVPKGAHLDNFAMEIDGRQVEAELLDANKARGIYIDIVRKLKDPALLEFAGRDAFKVRIFPIEPNSKKRVRLSYTELLKSDDGLVSYVLPLNTEKYSADPIDNVSVHVEVETKEPLKTVYSPSHVVEVKRHGSHCATIGYEAERVRPDNDFALYFAPEKDELGMNLLTCRTDGEDGYFLLLASPGLGVPDDKVVSKDVAFVLDTSGSMAGQKLKQAKKALEFCVENLHDGDRFQIIRFSTDVEPLFDKLVTASAKNRDRAESFINGLKAMGATDIDGALRNALALRQSRPSSDHDSRLSANSTDADPDSRATGDRPFSVVFLTDGQPTIGTTDEDQIVADAKDASGGRTRVFCFGIGTDVNTHLLDRVADETRAIAQYVLPDEDLELKLSSFFSKINEPVLANPSLTIGGDIRATQFYPSRLPDLFKGGQLVLVGRYSGHGRTTMSIEGSVNGEGKEFAYPANFPDEAPCNEFIPRLWATRRVGWLLDEIRLHGENAELRDEVTGLARQYGIVTPYTAYLILEDEKRRDVAPGERSFSRLDSDVSAQREAAKAWDAFKDQRAGESAIAGARLGNAFRTADAAAPAAASGAMESARALGFSAGGGGGAVGSPQGDGDKSRLIEYSQQTTFVAGRNFFWNDQQWIDSTVQKFPQAPRVRIEFGSPDYFALASSKPVVLPWLALGQRVQFILDGTIYEIYC